MTSHFFMSDHKRVALNLIDGRRLETYVPKDWSKNQIEGFWNGLVTAL